MLAQYPTIIEGASPRPPWEVFHHHVGWAQHFSQGWWGRTPLVCWEAKVLRCHSHKRAPRSAREGVCLGSCLRTGARQQCCPANWGRHKGGEVWRVVWTRIPPRAQTCQRSLNCCCIDSGSIPDGISCSPNCVQCADQRNKIVQSKKKAQKLKGTAANGGHLET